MCTFKNFGMTNVEFTSSSVDSKSFPWNGSIIHGFDEDVLARITNLRKKLHFTLSQKNRRNVSKIKFITQKAHLEYLANQSLLQLDIYNAAMKYDKNKLSTSNIGLAESIEQSTLVKCENQKKYNEAVSAVKTECLQREKIREKEIENELKLLNEKAMLKKNEAITLEKKAKELQQKSFEKKKNIENYQKYQEWKRINNEYQETHKKREELEAQFRNGIL